MDLNCDLGESFGAWSMGNDEALLDVVSSANVACGFHAGDPETMLATCRRAAANGVRVGAHPSYRDLAGFGRRAMQVAPDQLAAEVLYQLSALDGMARVAGTGLGYVKPHGALYNTIARDQSQAAAVVGAVRSFRAGLPILGLPDSAVEQECARQEVPFFREAFADRAYGPDGTLLPRSAPGAVLTDRQFVAERAVRLATTGRIAAADGSELSVRADSLCLHSDTPGAAALAVAVRQALEEAGVVIAAFC